ncbi:MAG TPA: DnaJ domain-containing protein, partial [Stenomitos sp.]
MEFVADEDYYEVLGVSPEADDAEIRKAYKKLAVKLHPDRFVDKPSAEREDAQHKFAKVSEAYNVLKDTEKRNEYDFMRRMGVSSPDPEPEAPTISPEEAAKRREMAEKRFRHGIALQ